MPKNVLKDWQQFNLQETHQRLSWLQQQPDGYLFQQTGESQIIAVKKVNSLLFLLLADPATRTTNLVQSILDLNQPFNLFFPYAQAMMLGLVWHPRPQKVGLIGLGGGTLPRLFHHYLEQTVIDCIEIDATVVAVAKQFFGMQPDARFKVAIAEGRGYLEQHPQTYDILMTDAGFGDGKMPHQLVTQEFFKLCKCRLVAGGVLVVHLFHKEALFNAAVLKTLKRVFDQVYQCCLTNTDWVAIATDTKFLERSKILFYAEVIQEFHGFEFSLIDRALQVEAVSESLDSLPILQDEVKVFF